MYLLYDIVLFTCNCVVVLLVVLLLLLATWGWEILAGVEYALNGIPRYRDVRSTERSPLGPTNAPIIKPGLSFCSVVLQNYPPSLRLATPSHYDQS